MVIEKINIHIEYLEHTVHTQLALAIIITLPVLQTLLEQPSHIVTSLPLVRSVHVNLL